MVVVAHSGFEVDWMIFGGQKGVGADCMIVVGRIGLAGLGMNVLPETFVSERIPDGCHTCCTVVDPFLAYFQVGQTVPSVRSPPRTWLPP